MKVRNRQSKETGPAEKDDPATENVDADPGWFASPVGQKGRILSLADLRRFHRTGEQAMIRPDAAYRIACCSRGSFYKGLRDGVIPSVRLGRSFLIPIGRFLEWLGASDGSSFDAEPQEEGHSHDNSDNHAE